MANTWLETFKREAGIRRCVILSGNTLDVYKLGIQYAPIQNIVIDTLKSIGFTDAILWDRFSGAKNIIPDRATELSEAIISGQPVTAPSRSSNTLDLSNDNPAERIFTDIDEFLPIVNYHLTHQDESRIAFILDWSQYLFGKNGISEEDRQRLIVLSKSLNNAPLALGLPNSELRKTRNMLVLLTSQSETVPLTFRQNNACVKEILIPTPDVNERREFLEENPPNVIYGNFTLEDVVAATDNLTIRDLIQLGQLSHQHSEKLNVEKLLNLYRYGTKKSPWEDLTKERIEKNIAAELNRVKGQKEAIEKVMQVIKRAFTGLSGVQHSKKQRSPKGVLFFVGPTGVGKTELAKALAKGVFGDEDACIRFDMSEFSQKQSDQRLIGSPPGYVGYENGGELTNAVKERPFAVLLFDEIEKANEKILDKFLQILEDGRLTDSKGDTASFAETIIIFTSNIGASDVNLKDASGNYRDSEQIKSEFIAKVKDHFKSELNRPELLNRIGDNIVPFNFITRNDFLFAIAQSKIYSFRETLKEKYKIADFQIGDTALEAAIAGVDIANGGRGVLNELVKTIIDPLTDELFKLTPDDPTEEKCKNTRGKTIVVSDTLDITVR